MRFFRHALPQSNSGKPRGDMLFDAHETPEQTYTLVCRKIAITDD